ncbi:hypothetical protein SPSYN_01104 [Sporotomaculum syntrophicum]|uniref:GmrSD restriction endonucleases N-terminal domain-containing protein n=1 Tax=Sporotomaculum syntrophicum TaxID=182264 RepID=A0A9D2WPH7_9FIRM|nr:DUF262 domain-containing protein [Sporotomaculum syntrophicum]KAF1084968.1 hypothetical protein SPSYN_01104 [Sporotomaculum syntrophicum]
MRTSATNRRLRVLLYSIAEGTLKPRPDFQRRLVWNNKHKNAFIRTVLEELPFPEIYVAAGEVDDRTARGTELLVDGQQRMTTLFQYFKGSAELKLEKDIIPYDQLTSDSKMRFLEYEVVVRDLGAVPFDTIMTIFQRINSTSYSLNAMEINNSRYDGEMKNLSFRLSEHVFFEEYKVFSSTDIKRMQDVKFCLTLIITVFSTYFHRDDAFEEFLEKYDEEFEQGNTIFKELNRVLEVIDQMNISPNSRAFKKADLFTLIIELHRLMFKDKIEINSTILRDALICFYEKVESSGKFANKDDPIGEYYRATLQASNDRGSRITRGRVLRDIIKGVC